MCCCQVHKVTQGYAPQASDELELVLGDYIYLDEKELEGSADGWVHGTSWLTGDVRGPYAPSNEHAPLSYHSPPVRNYDSSH